MQACRRTARNAYRRALRADLDASPCRWFAPRRLCIEGPGPPLPLIREGATAFDARPFSIQLLKPCSTLDFGDTVILVWHLRATLIRTRPARQRGGVLSLNGIVDDHPAPELL